MAILHNHEEKLESDALSFIYLWIMFFRSLSFPLSLCFPLFLSLSLFLINTTITTPPQNPKIN